MQEVRSYYVTNGSAALAAEEIPYEDSRQRKLRMKKEEVHRINKRRKAHEIAMRRSKLRAFMLFLCVVAFGGLFFLFVHLQSGIQESLNNIASLEDQLADAKSANAAAESRISTAANLTYVRNRATNELGMHYAGNEQIKYFELNGSDYMVVYDQVP